MSKTIKEILDEEVNSFISSLNEQELVGILPLIQENIKLISVLNQLDKDTYDPNEQIINENWKFFVSCLEKVKQDKEFKVQSMLVLAKLYCVKQFSSLEFSFPTNIEDVLKFELKKYFNQLITQDGEEFIHILFSLPFEFTSLVVHFVITQSNEKDVAEIVPPQISVEEFMQYVISIKEKVIKNINDTSLSITSNFDLQNVKLLLQVKAFYSYNALNVGCLEYCMRLFKNKKAQENLYERFGQDAVEIMEAQILQHPSYIEYLKKIKNNTLQPFFLSDGTQNDKRPKTFNQFTIELFNPQDVIPQSKPIEDNSVITQPTDLEQSKKTAEAAEGEGSVDADATQAEVDPITGEPITA